MFSCRAATTAARSRGFIAGSGVPSLAETVISRASLLKSFDFWASCRPLRCMMFLNWEWPAMRFLLDFVLNCLGFVRDKWNGKRGLIGRDPGEIKGLAKFFIRRKVALGEAAAQLTHCAGPPKSVV